MQRKYNTYNLLKLLVEGFSERELRYLIRNLEGFQPLYSQLSDRATVVELADKIIEYAVQKNRIDKLLDWLKENNPSRYTRHEPYYDKVDDGVSTATEVKKGELPSITPTDLGLESPYGTIPPESPFYIERKADRDCWELVRRDFGMTLFLQAPRQMGKSSFIRRITYKAAKELEKEVVYIDLQKFSEPLLTDEKAFLIEFCVEIGDALDIPDDTGKYWNRRGRSNITTCTSYMTQHILPHVSTSLILAIDEVEHLLTSPFRSDFLAMLRAWHNSRAFDENMAKMSLILSSSMEPYLLMENIHQSPFNVGQRLQLDDFTNDEVAELNRLHNSPLDQQQLDDLMAFLNGHPFLTRLALYFLATKKFDLDTLIAQAAEDTGPFGSHLRSLRQVVDSPELKETLSEILLNRTHSKDQPFYYLKQTGLIKEDGHRVIIRNSLYHRYFLEHLNLKPTANLISVGGPVQIRGSTYVTRPADEELFSACKAGQFCYILACRQIGKSSLMIETSQRLRAIGTKTVLIDLNAIGSNTTEDSWYFVLAHEIIYRLRLDFAIETWWKENSFSTPSNRLQKFLTEVVLSKIAEPIAIFIDEVDLMLGLEFSDEFFATIRAIYNARAQYPVYQRLTFVLLGVATPDELIKDKTRTPFNIGQAITLNDFTREECTPFRIAIETLYPRQGHYYFNQIYDWTVGHPYLTQKLCKIFLDTPNPKSVDELVIKNFLAAEVRGEDNIQYVQTRVASDTLAQEMLRIYKRVLQGDPPVPDNAQSLPITRLKLYGLVITQDGYLRVRNKLYAYALNLDWVDDMLKVFERAFYLVTRFFEKAGLTAQVVDMEQDGKVTSILVRGQDPRYQAFGDIYVRCIEEAEGKIEQFESLRNYVLEKVGKNKKINPLDGRLAFFISDQKPTLGMLLTLYSYKAESNFTIVPLDKDYVNLAILKEDTRPELDSAVDRHIGKVNQYEGSKPIDDPVWFFGHELTIDTVVRYLHQGQHVGIFGLRKMGKTSLIRQIQYKLNNDLTCHIDLQAISRNCHYLYGEIIRRLAYDLRRHTDFLPFLQLFSQDYSDEDQQIQAFRADIEVLTQEMAKQNRDFKVVVFLDEVDLLLPVSATAKVGWWRNLLLRQFWRSPESNIRGFNKDGFKGFERFLAILRGLAQEKGHLVVAVTSVNADINRIPRWELGTSRDNPMWQALVECFLPPLKIDEANLMIESIGSIMGIKYDYKSLDEIYRLSGGHPFIARQICSSIVDECHTRQITPIQVQKGFERFLTDRTTYFETLWQDVIDTLFQRTANTVRHLLAKIATSTEIPMYRSNERIDNIVKTLKEIYLLDGDEMVKIRMDSFAKWICRTKS